jgi:tRNA(fMet)-specific endonuclease VapC
MFVSVDADRKMTIWGCILDRRQQRAQHYGVIRAALEKLGQPIGVNDMHIAAHARSEGLVLVTNNMGEFARVPALEAENWVHTAQ